jgi:uncharacterized membrane protein
MAPSMSLQERLLWITTVMLAAAAIIALAWHGDAGRAVGAACAAWVFGISAAAVRRQAHSAGGGDP